MPLWGVADSNAGEPKNLSSGTFQGTAGKVIYGVEIQSKVLSMARLEMLVSMQHHMQDGLESTHTWTCMEI